LLILAVISLLTLAIALASSKDTDIVAAKSPQPTTQAGAGSQPAIARDSIVLQTTHGRQSGGYEIPGWVPAIEFRVNGPIQSGSRLAVEFTLGGKPWVSFDCATEETPIGKGWKVSCEGDEIPAGKQMTYKGPVDFTIRLRNELQGTNTTLFVGKANVVMGPAFKGATKPEEMEYYVDEDWRIPVGYAFWEKDTGHQGAMTLHVLFWYRGDTADIEEHLFYQGKDIAKCSIPGNGAADWHPDKPRWGFADCGFLGVYPTAPAEDEAYDPRFSVRNNPGDYEVKVLMVGHLARSIKFKVGSDGSFDNGIAAANALGSDRVILPVQVIGTQEPWNKNAWKTDAFYGNPLKGSNAP